MTSSRTLAALAALALGLSRSSAAGPAVDDEQLPEAAAALAADDQCAGSDEECALNALQMRYARMAPDDGAPDDDEGDLEDFVARRHHHHYKPRDLDKQWKIKIEDQLKVIAKNVTTMESKLAYLAEDLESAKQKLYNNPNAPIGVNDTIVDWSKHPGSWIPVFALFEEDAQVESELDEEIELPYAEVPDEGYEVDDDDNDADLEEVEVEDGDDELEAEVGSGKHKKKLKRHKKVKGEITFQQKRLAMISPQMGYIKGNITWLNDYMARQPRYLEGKLVLAQEKAQTEEEAAYMRSMTNRRRRTTPPEEEQQPREPQEDLMDMIDETNDAADKIWESFGNLGMETEAVKRRVELWKRGHPPLPHKYAVSEDLPAQEFAATVDSHDQVRRP